MNIYTSENGYAYGIISPIGSSNPKPEPVTTSYHSWLSFNSKSSSENGHQDEHHIHHHHHHQNDHDEHHSKNAAVNFLSHIFHYTEWKKQQEAEKNRFDVKKCQPETRKQLKQLYVY